MNKRGEEEGSSITGTLIAVILALLVIFLIFYFLFHNGSWDFFKNLPGNKYNKTDQVVQLPPDQNILNNYYKVAVIQDGKYLLFCTDSDCNKLRKSNLYWYGEEKNGGIYVDQNWAIDKKIADVVGGKIKISTEVLAGGNLYEKVQNLLRSYEDLINLEDSIYISGKIYRDKKVEVNSGDKIFGKTTIVAPADRGASFFDKVTNLKTGEVFITDGRYQFVVSHPFSQETFDCTIKFEKINDNEYVAYAGYVDSKGNAIWHQLDCNKKGWVGKTMSVDMFKKTMIETIDENCKW